MAELSSFAVLLDLGGIFVIVTLVGAVAPLNRRPSWVFTSFACIVAGHLASYAVLYIMHMPRTAAIAAGVLVIAACAWPAFSRLSRNPGAVWSGQGPAGARRHSHER